LVPKGCTSCPYRGIRREPPASSILTLILDVENGNTLVDALLFARDSSPLTADNQRLYLPP
jgi:hypothetical protein